MVSIHRKHDKMSTDDELTQEASGSSTQGPAGSSAILPPNIVMISQVALQQKADEANHMYESCISCGRRCEDNRSAGKLGKCRTGMKAFVSSHFPHTGEETCLVGTNGSGTIFFGNCNLKVHSLNGFAKYIKRNLLQTYNDSRTVFHKLLHNYAACKIENANHHQTYTETDTITRAHAHITHTFTHRP